jgi:UDPglucose 6-dehydrogenase
MKIGFIGLGKLGLPCAEYIANCHKYDVYGYDSKPVESNKIKICDNIESVLKDSIFTFIAVPTPHNNEYDGSKPTSHLPPKDFDYSIVKDLLKKINEIESDTIIVLISTVLPGTINREFLPYINKNKFLYNPYLIAMGSVEEDMCDPEMIIIGGNYDISRTLVKFYSEITNCNRYEIGTWEEAESIKIFYNTFISMKIMFANTILDVADSIGNIDADKVTRALAFSNKRIMSASYMTPGMGDGGPCHPRDNIALSSLSNRLNLGYDLFGEISKIRELQAYNLALKLVQYKNPVVILGSSYKPGVDLKDGSYSLLVGNYIKNEGLDVYYDQNPNIDGPLTYLLGHRYGHENHNFVEGSIIFDPWGYVFENKNCKVIRYGR